MKVLGTIGTFVVGTAVGFVTCGYLTVRGVLKSERHRKALANVVSEKVNKELFEKRTDTYRVEYVPYPKRCCRSRVSYRKMNEEREPIDIVFDSGAEAETAFKHIKELMEEHSVMTVADVADICELESTYSDNGYGWVTTSGMYIDKSDECTLHLPSPRPIE